MVVVDQELYVPKLNAQGYRIGRAVAAAVLESKDSRQNTEPAAASARAVPGTITSALVAALTLTALW